MQADTGVQQQQQMILYAACLLLPCFTLERSDKSIRVQPFSLPLNNLVRPRSIQRANAIAVKTRDTQPRLSAKPAITVAPTKSVATRERH